MWDITHRSMLLFKMKFRVASSGIRGGRALFEKLKFGECKKTRLVETDKIVAYRDTVKVISELQSPIGGQEF